MSITGNMTLGELLKVYPESFDVFLANGFQFDSAEDMLDAVGETTMLQTIARVRELNAELICYHIEEKILQTEKERQFLMDNFTTDEKLDFYGNTICPLKFTFKDALEDIVKKEYQDSGTVLKCYVEAGRNDNGFCEGVWVGEELEKLPNILFSKEFNVYLEPAFVKAMCGKGYFENNFYKKKDRKFEEAGLWDDQGDFCVYAAMADIFLIDKEQLGDLPVPKTLADLLNPIYQDKIIIFGKQRSEVSNAVLLYTYKEFGEEGIRKLAANVKHALHGSTMSKVAGSNRPEAGAVYLVSGFFAHTSVKGDLGIVWPEDGAMTLPMYMLVKKDSTDKVKDIVSYITGEEFAQACIKAHTPVMLGGVENCIPADGKLKWLGWDYIRNNDLSEINRKAQSLFHDTWAALHPEGELFK